MPSQDESQVVTVEVVPGEGESFEKLALGTKLSADIGTAYPGRIEIDQWERGQYGQQWRYAVRPLSFKIGGKTGMFHEWAKLSQAKRSKMGVAILAFSTVFGTKNPDGTDLMIGEGQLVGRIAMFNRKEISLGTDKQGEEMKFEVLYPVRLLTEEELANLPDLTVEQGELREPAPAASVELTGDDVAALQTFLVGKTEREAKSGAARSSLSPQLKQLVMMGRVQSSVAILVDGKYTPVVASAD